MVRKHLPRAEGDQGPSPAPGAAPAGQQESPPPTPRSPKTARQKHPRASPRRATQQSSWGQARANQPCHSHTTGWKGSRVPAASELLLCLQQHPRNIVSNQLSGNPTQSDFLHSAALPIPRHCAMPVTARRSLSPSQLGQRGNRASATAAWGPGTTAAMSLWLPTLLLSLSTGQNRQQEVAPKTRAYPRGQGQRGPPAPLLPSCAPGLSAGSTSLALVLAAVGRKWKETENLQLSLLLHHSFSSSPSCLGPRAPSSPGDCSQSKAPEPAPAQGWQSCHPSSSHSHSCPESLSGHLDGK